MSERVRQHLAGEPATGSAGGTTLYECSICKALALRAGDPCPNGCIKQWRDAAMELVRVVRAHGGRPVRVGSEREGWRARLANVERLLEQATVEGIVTDGRSVHEALAEVRSMIDGDAG